MITFKQFLQESRSAPLYHGTSFDVLKSIIRQDTINTGTGKSTSQAQRPGKPTVFLTRSLKHAKYFSDMFSYKPIIIELDQSKLIQRYRIRPIKNWSKESYSNKPMYSGTEYGNEFEEYLDKPIKNVSRYINRILVVDNYDFEEIRDYIKNKTKLLVPVELVK